MPTISREYRIYLALWRKAFREQDQELIIQVPNLGMAVAMRQGMYRAIRPFRQETMNDEELRKAAEKFVVYMEKAKKSDEPHFLKFRERKALTILEASFDALGIDEEDLLLSEEKTLRTELDHLIEGNVTPLHKTTPFYTRD